MKSKNTNGIKPIILSGHTDTVPVSKSWSTDPFKATIKGDKLYGRGFSSNISTELRKTVSRHLLHAQSIEFTHPKTNKSIKICSDIPNDFKIFFEAIN